MIYINKNRTPTGLLGYLDNTAKIMQSYEGENKKPVSDSFTKKEHGLNGAFDELRTSLVNEQKGICCYCQSRIEFSPKKADGTGLVIKIKTEHFLPKSKYPNKALDYSNLLASCKGNSILNSKGGTHCDSKKDNLELRYIQNPSLGKKKDFKTFFRVIVHQKSKEVRITSLRPNEVFTSDIETILNLNEQNLKARRFSAWKTVNKKLKTDSTGKYTIRTLKEQLNIYKPTSKSKELKEFCGFITSWLEGKIKSHSK